MSEYKKICITNRHIVLDEMKKESQTATTAKKTSEKDMISEIVMISETDLMARYLERIKDADADMIILREKDMSEQEYENLARKVMNLCQSEQKQLVLHSYVDVAKGLGHRAIHVPFHAFLEMDAADRLWFWTIGVSTHSVEEAVICERLGASYITASHIFPTKCKEGLEPRGLDYLSDVRKAVKMPVYALGGIHPDNISKCIDAGADGVCMMSEYMKRHD